MANPIDPVAAQRPPLGNGHDPQSPNGHGPSRKGRLGGRPTPGRRLPGPTVKPAAIVFGIIAFIFVVGFIADDITSAHHPTATPAATVPRAVPGTGGLVPERSTTVIGPIVGSDEPPANVLAALVVPKGTVAVPGSASQRGLGLYDATIDLQVPAVEQHTITFVRAELAAGKWDVVSSGASGTGYQFIAQHPGSDGYEWEAGITVAPTAFTSAVAGQPVPPSGVTPVTLRLFAISDAS